jgi:hypothetical protein
VNDLGKPLPVVFRDTVPESDEFKGFPELKSFAQKPVSSTDNEGETEEKQEKQLVLDDTDPFICDAFRTISTFAPLILSDVDHKDSIDKNGNLSSLNENYLWRAIYPKLPNGKPCYNPNGKYAIKVFIAGKWRKVYVDDSIPITADGKPAIAFSGDRLELWPLLLAKAVYTVYSASG